MGVSPVLPPPLLSACARGTSAVSLVLAVASPSATSAASFDAAADDDGETTAALSTSARVEASEARHQAATQAPSAR